MLHIINEKDCCGCGACSIVCPSKCITMSEGTLGHLFPYIENEKCIGCGACESVCPMINNKLFKKNIEQTAYAAYAKDGTERFSGSSGGMFGVFARQLLQNGYTVYGAAFDENLQLKCSNANCLEELKSLYKSKYLQSDLTGKYEEIKKKLKDGEKVFFVSTPCQVRALKLYLKSDYENLITVDFFCHGVPSQKFFDHCKNVEEEKQKGRVVGYQFRTKVKNGSTPHYFTEEIICKDEKHTVTDFYFKSPFYAFFQKYINLRESCYNCQFAGTERASDITIGDFHDIEKYVTGINRFDGVSTVVINTVKGENLWSLCENNIEKFDVNLEQLIADGVCFGKGTSRPLSRDEFLNDYNSLEMGNLINKWVKPHSYYKQALYYKLPRAVRNKLKGILGL